MGRKKFCQNIGKKHIYIYVYPSIGGQAGGETVYRCQKVCRICKYKKKNDKSASGVWTWDNGKYIRMPDGWYNSVSHT